MTFSLSLLHGIATLEALSSLEASVDIDLLARGGMAWKKWFQIYSFDWMFDWKSKEMAGKEEEEEEEREQEKGI